MLEQIREFLGKRRRAYCRVLDKNNTDVQIILADLAKFCRAHETTFDPDERATALLEGRREVWLRIQSQLNLTEEELWNLHSQRIKNV